jgi:hypothetical protein
MVSGSFENGGRRYGSSVDVVDFNDLSDVTLECQRAVIRIAKRSYVGNIEIENGE